MALLPPVSAKLAQVMVFLQRDDLGPQLAAPLAKTLNPRTPQVTTMTPADKAKVDELTRTHVYSFTLTQAQDGNAVVVLTRIKP